MSKVLYSIDIDFDEYKGDITYNDIKASFYNDSGIFFKKVRYKSGDLTIDYVNMMNDVDKEGVNYIDEQDKYDDSLLNLIDCKWSVFDKGMGRRVTFITNVDINSFEGLMNHYLSVMNNNYGFEFKIIEYNSGYVERIRYYPIRFYQDFSLS